MSASRQTTLKGAKAQRVWEIFRQVSRVPRRSKNEELIIEWLRGFAADHNLACRSDAVGNVVIELPATRGYENAPTIVLQSHVDMVCEKTPASKHDFSKDPIEIIERDGWVCADGTTLGADNGLGVSLALSLVEEKLPHPKLELLFTVDEETGLTGANGLQQPFITGKYLINLDGEDESFIIGCAGGEQTEITVTPDWLDAPAGSTSSPQSGFDCFALRVSGLRGGHSGIDIDKRRANAVVLLARTMSELDEQVKPFICSIEGGSAHNAIPRDAQAVICLDPSEIDRANQVLNSVVPVIAKEYASADPDLAIQLIPQDGPYCERVFAPAVAGKVINLLLAIPDGVYRMSSEFKGTVDTSGNLARVETARKENLLRITTSQRSFNVSRLEHLTAKITAAASRAGARTMTSGRYPGWEPDTDSQLLKRCIKVYSELRGKTPPTKVVHAGLEPAVIKQKFPDIEAVSVGPTIESPHSPQERVEIASVDSVWKFLLELIPALS